MRFALIGGVHGDEPLGVEVVRRIQEQGKDAFRNECEALIAHPEALLRRQRFMDFDLNRCFGAVQNIPRGVEQKRSLFLRDKLEGRFDFLLDFHTTTSSMGITLILTSTTDILSRKAALYLKQKNPQINILQSLSLDGACPYINRLAPSSLTVEVGPVAHNIPSQLLFATYQVAILLLNWVPEAFDQNSLDIPYFESVKDLYYPEGGGPWFIHPEREHADFQELSKGAPLFVNWEGRVKYYKGPEIAFPIFINEPAYQKDGLAMTLTRKKFGLSL